MGKADRQCAWSVCPAEITFDLRSEPRPVALIQIASKTFRTSSGSVIGSKGFAITPRAPSPR